MRQRLAARQGQIEHLEIAGVNRGFDLGRPEPLRGVAPAAWGRTVEGAHHGAPLGVGWLDVSPSPDPASPAPGAGWPPAARPGAGGWQPCGRRWCAGAPR